MTNPGTSTGRIPANVSVKARATVTAGFKWAPDTGPNVRMSATSAAPVAIVFARSAMATLPPPGALP